MADDYFAAAYEPYLDESIVQADTFSYSGGTDNLAPVNTPEMRTLPTDVLDMTFNAPGGDYFYKYSDPYSGEYNDWKSVGLPKNNDDVLRTFLEAPAYERPVFVPNPVSGENTLVYPDGTMISSGTPLPSTQEAPSGSLVVDLDPASLEGYVPRNPYANLAIDRSRLGDVALGYEQASSVAGVLDTTKLSEDVVAMRQLATSQGVSGGISTEAEGAPLGSVDLSLMKLKAAVGEFREKNPNTPLPAGVKPVLDIYENEGTLASLRASTRDAQVVAQKELLTAVDKLSTETERQATLRDQADSSLKAATGAYDRFTTTIKAGPSAGRGTEVDELIRSGKSAYERGDYALASRKYDDAASLAGRLSANPREVVADDFWTKTYADGSNPVNWNNVVPAIGLLGSLFVSLYAQPKQAKDQMKFQERMAERSFEQQKELLAMRMGGEAASAAAGKGSGPAASAPSLAGATYRV